MTSFVSRRCAFAAVAFAASWLIVSPARAVHFGEPVPAREHQAVGTLYVQAADGSVSYGTGTLLSSNMVLTVAHVVEGAATPFHIWFVSDVTPNLAIHAIAYRIHPGYYGEKPLRDWPQDSLQANDIALVRLAGNYPFEGPNFRVSAEKPRRGREVTVIGCGRNEAGEGQVRRSGQLEYLRERNGFYVFQSTAEQFQRVDKGDSGGPLFVESEDGQRDIVALVQGGDAMLSSERHLGADEYAYFVSFAAHVDWFTRRWTELQELKPPQEKEIHFIVRPAPGPPQPAVSFRTMLTLLNAKLPDDRARGIIAARGMCDPVSAETAQKWAKEWLPNDKIRRIEAAKFTRDPTVK